MENNLVIGNTSQLSHFFPNSYTKISSRNIDFGFLQKEWESAYITFAENRVYLGDIDYIKVNYIDTIKIVEHLVDKSKKIVVYTSGELWNNYEGPVSLKDKVDYTYSNKYCLSKRFLIDHIKQYRESGIWKNVIIIHPFNFNSTHRNKNFLFGKIFDSIINNNKIEIGNTYFYRDITHAKYVAKRSIDANEDQMIGSGRLTFINDFIRDLYKHFEMNYNDYVKENLNNEIRHKIPYYVDQEKVYSYDTLLNDTIEDIENRINEK